MHQTATSSQLISRGSGVWQQPVDMRPDLRLQPMRATRKHTHTRTGTQEQSVTPVRLKATCTCHNGARAPVSSRFSLMLRIERQADEAGLERILFLRSRSFVLLNVLMGCHHRRGSSDGRRQWAPWQQRWCIFQIQLLNWQNRNYRIKVVDCWRETHQLQSCFLAVKFVLEVDHEKTLFF